VTDHTLVCRIVTKNISSALIIEDDADWDIRIRQQLHDMALSTQALTQPLIAAPGSYADPTYPSAEPDANTPVHEIPFDNLPETIAPRDSPYGDDWDLIWVGHCGQRMPPPDSPLPRGRVVHRDEMSTPAKKYLWSMAHPYTLVDDYPEHTRVVHHSQEGVCTLGYAISQKGARAVLQHVALQDLDAAVDILLRYFCEGLSGRTRHNCLAIQPALFNHHRPRGPLSSESNIGNHGDGFRETASTDMVRWSVRMNAETLMSGGSEFWDQLPDP
jgi:GR25 family glycosyltransferase involved in LPS biosynthesis